LRRCALMHKRIAFVADNDGFDRLLWNSGLNLRR
jgi:hypothetical protein